MNFRGLLLTAMAASAILLPRIALADTISVHASTQGWVNQNGFNDPTNSNTLVGNCGAGDCNTGEFRNFFNFNIPVITDNVASVTLQFFGGLESFSQSGTITYTVTSTPAFDFSDLGNGTVYGSFTESSPNPGFRAGLPFSISLNQAAISAIGTGGGVFEISGRVTSPVNFGAAQPDQFILAGQAQPSLIIETSAGAAVPEPASWALMIGGFGLAGAALRRRRAVPA